MKPMRKRILSLFLSMLMVLGCLPLTAGAASSQTIYYESSNIRYGTAFSFKNPYGDGFPGGTHNWNSTTHVSYIHVGSGIGYCIQPGIRIGDGPGDKVEYAGGSDSSYYKKFPAARRRALGLVSLYGYPNDMTDKNAYYATQVLIWGLVIGQVDPNDFTGTNKFYTCLDEDSKKAVKPYYESLLNQLKSHETRPSFTAASSSQAKPITLQWDNGSKRYEATVTDSNEVLSKFNFTASGLTISRKGNQLILSSTQPITSPISVSSDKAVPEVKVGSQLVWTSNEYMQQEVLSGAPTPSPVTAWLKVQTEKTGTIALKKTSEDGKVSGVKFLISGNGISKTVTTGKDGSVNVTDLPAGTYTVSEVEIPSYYEAPESQTVKLTAGQTASVSFSNALKDGQLIVTKTAEDGFKEGFIFRLTGTADSGEKIDLTAVTGKDGKAVFQNVPIGSGYVLSEENTPDRYVVPEDQTADIEWNKVTNKSFTNTLKKFRVQLHKSDAETGTAQGDAVLDGAQYTLYNEQGKELETLTITDGTAISGYYPCQTITIRETKAPAGYQLDDTVYTVEAPADEQTDEHITLIREVKEKVIKGKIAIRKYLAQADSEEKLPMEGIEFTVTLNSDPNIKEVITTNAEGYAETGLLPYGVYTVTETEYPESVTPIEPFTVTISEHQKTYEFVLDNSLKCGKVSGWKVDQDGFELGGAVIGLFHFDETEFTEETALMVTGSNEIGYFEFAIVPYGRYLVKEIQSPTGFLLSADTFPVEIKEGGQVIEITIENQIIKGTVETIKVDTDYPDHKLSGAVFEIYADVDHDGKFNADIDKLAGEMTETEPGLYQMENLVYGNYFLHEKEAPEFFEKDDGYYPFSITENGEVVRVGTEAGVGFLNQAQTGSLKVVKTADDDKIKGRIFKITGTDFMGNAYEQEFTTDENGEIHVTLRVGKYTVSEVAGEDAQKYILPDDQTVEIKAGETTTVKMHNRLVPEVPSVPQTGDNPWRPIVIGALAIGAVLTGGVLIVLQRSRKSKNNAGR